MSDLMVSSVPVSLFLWKCLKRTLKSLAFVKFGMCQEVQCFEGRRDKHISTLTVQPGFLR